MDKLVEENKIYKNNKEIEMEKVSYNILNILNVWDRIYGSHHTSISNRKKCFTTSRLCQRGYSIQGNKISHIYKGLGGSYSRN